MLKGGFVKKNHQSGRPIKKGNFIVLIPWKSPYCRKGISDIEFIWQGRHYAFEVKTPEEHGYINRNLKKIMSMKPSELSRKSNLKKRHIYEQFEYIMSIKRAGGFGGFVSSLENVKKYLKESLPDK